MTTYKINGYEINAETGHIISPAIKDAKLPIVQQYQNVVSALIKLTCELYGRM